MDLDFTKNDFIILYSILCYLSYEDDSVIDDYITTYELNKLSIVKSDIYNLKNRFEDLIDSMLKIA